MTGPTPVVSADSDSSATANAPTGVSGAELSRRTLHSFDPSGDDEPTNVVPIRAADEVRQSSLASNDAASDLPAIAGPELDLDLTSAELTNTLGADVRPAVDPVMPTAVDVESEKLTPVFSKETPKADEQTIDLAADTAIELDLVDFLPPPPPEEDMAEFTENWTADDSTDLASPPSTPGSAGDRRIRFGRRR